MAAIQDERLQALERIERSILGIKACIIDSRWGYHAKAIFGLHDDTRLFCHLAKLLPAPLPQHPSIAHDFPDPRLSGDDGRQVALDSTLKFVVSLHIVVLQRGAPYKNFEDDIGDLDRPKLCGIS